MKNTNIISILLAALTLASSCNRDEAGLYPPEQGDRAVTITAAPAQTKTALEGGAVKWEDGDEIDLVFTHATDAPAVHKFSTSLENASLTADFTGTLPLEVYREEGEYDELVKAVYPSGHVSASGEVEFALPAEQKVRTDGTFAAGLNLASASVSLADMQDDGNASATFRNALSILRFTLQDDVTSVTLTGTSPLAGKAPLTFVTDGDDAGRLVVSGDWAEDDKSMSVTLKPADGSECFPGGEVNMLVWPGQHTSMSVTVNFKEYGEFRKSKSFDFEFQPSRYYTLDLNADSEELVSDITDRITALEGDLGGLESRLEALESAAEKISLLVGQIQSVALMTEYLDNAVYAPYGRGQSTERVVKKTLTLDYKVRPAKAMELLLDVCADEDNLSDVLSAKIDQKAGNLEDLTVTRAVLEGDVLTVTVDAAGIPDNFYKGWVSASVALEISDGNTEILSDFAHLVPKKQLVLRVADGGNLPAMRGANLSFGVELGLTDPTAPLTATVEDVNGFASVPTVRMYKESYSGYISMSFKEDDNPAEMSFKVVLSDGNETDSVEFTFEDVGELVLDYTSEIGYVGGSAFVTAVLPQNNYTYVAPSMSMRNYQTQILYYPATSQYDHDRIYYYDWAYETVQGTPGSYTVEPNTPKTVDVENPGYKKYNSTTLQWEIVAGQPEYLTLTLNTGEKDRSFYVDVSVETATVPKYTYTKTATITQKQNGTAIDESMYYQNGDVIILQEADPKYATPLNIVILGDGYQKKDLQKGGKFMRSARSACDAFFGVAPFSHFRDRFNVYAVAYESVDEGIDILSQNLNKDTYFEAYWNGNSTAAWVTDSGRDKVINVVKNTLGLDTDAEYYRTVALVLSNVDAVAGSCGYPYRDLYSNTSVVGEDYASFAIAVLPANSTATGSLIRHELGGHGFGRLGDEYPEESYGSDLDTWHAKGFYRNVTTDQDSWNWNAFIGLQGYENVGYIWRNNNYWCPTDGGIMYNNNGTFNPPCRQIIYERIIRQTEGYNAYSWGKFLEYDKQNIQ